MIHAAVVAALVTISLGISADAMAKSRGSSHAPSHSSSGSHPNHADEAHVGEGGGGGVVRNVVGRSGRSDGNANDAGAAPSAAVDEQDPSQRRIREARAAARAKADAEDLAARKLAEAAAEDKRRQQAAQAAIAAAEEQKRRDAADSIKNKELAALERQRALAAWEARCQIKPVMTDEEIDTCREVWSKPPR